MHVPQLLATQHDACAQHDACDSDTHLQSLESCDVVAGRPSGKRLIMPKWLRCLGPQKFCLAGSIHAQYSHALQQSTSSIQSAPMYWHSRI